MPDNHKMMVTIKGNVDRMRRMTGNANKNRFSTPQPNRFMSHTLNQSMQTVSRTVLPALQPDFGINRIDRPRYFEDASQAVNCLFQTYKL